VNGLYGKQAWSYHLRTATLTMLSWGCCPLAVFSSSPPALKLALAVPPEIF
jgi:hypothetical protein